MSRILARHGFAAVVATFTLTAIAVSAQPAAFPSKPIHFIAPYVAGGTTDLVARTVGAKVTEKFGQPVIVENRGGAGGDVGRNAVAKAAPDGYTIGFGAISTNALNPHVYAIANTPEAAVLRSRVSTICCVAVFRASHGLR